jgi:hypothetical protein
MLTHLKHNWFYYLAGALVLALILIEAQGQNDFDIFLAASRDLWQKKNVYTTMYNEWYHYYYGVFFAILLTPLTFLPVYVAKIVWLLCNVFFAYRIWKIVSGWLPLQQLDKKKLLIFGLLCFALSLRFLRDNFHLSQVTVFILYLTLEGLYLIEKDRKIPGSLLLAMGIDIKLLPVIMIPYLLYRKEWKAAGFVLAFVVLLILLPIIFIGYDYNNELLSARFLLLNPANQAHILDTSERSMHSLTTLLATLLVKDSRNIYDLEIPRNIADISIEQLNLVINICRALFVLGTLWFLRTWPFKPSNSKLHKLYEIGYLCVVIPLIFPHQQPYAFLFGFPAMAYLLFYTLYLYYYQPAVASDKHFKRKKLVLTVLLVLVYLTTSCHFILGQFNAYYDHFKIVTYGILLLVGVLAACPPERLEKRLQQI